MARRYTIQSSLPNTHTVCIELDDRRQAGEEGGREGARKDGGWGEGGQEGREEASGGGSEQRSEREEQGGAWEEGRYGGRETSRET